MRVVADLKLDLEKDKKTNTLQDLKTGKKEYTSAKLLNIDPPYKMEVWLSQAKDSDVARKYVVFTSNSRLEVMQQFWDNI